MMEDPSKIDKLNIQIQDMSAGDLAFTYGTPYASWKHAIAWWGNNDYRGLNDKTYINDKNTF